ncbi:MAG TPA: class E sortase [Solirubrobacterales bacterium]|nr:class E sortase [Solirubrobacterales bacterium]
MRRLLRIFSVALVTAGLVVLADAALTLAWKEPVSAVYGQLQQDQARDQLRDLEARFFDDEQIDEINAIGDPVRRANRLATRFSRKLKIGEGIGRIEIPSANIEYVIVEGTDTETLKKGPGRYPETFLPGQGNTIGIAGHRTTYGAPFRNIDKIADGDEITVEMPYATFTYEVEKSRIVEPTDVEIVRSVGRERLVLTACHPLYSAAQRYAVFADLVDVTLLPGGNQA